MSVKSAYVSFGFPVVDLPRCGCGNDFVEVSIDFETDGRQVFLVGHTVCDECKFEPAFSNPGSDCQSWHEAVLRCVNAWSVARGGVEYSRLGALPDQLEELVEVAESRLGSLPDFRARTLAKFVARGLH